MTFTKDDIPESERAKSFTHQGKWARFWIVMGGPLANFILAFFILKEPERKKSNQDSEKSENVEAIQEIEGEIIIKSVPGMKEREDMKMIEEGAEDMITQEIKVSKKQADRDLIVKIEKIDMKKILNEVIEEIEKKGQTIMIKIRDLKTKETVKNNIILPERKAKAQKISQNKMII